MKVPIGGGSAPAFALTSSAYNYPQPSVKATVPYSSAPLCSTSSANTQPPAMPYSYASPSNTQQQAPKSAFVAHDSAPDASASNKHGTHASMESLTAVAAHLATKMHAPQPSSPVRASSEEPGVLLAGTAARAAAHQGLCKRSAETVESSMLMGKRLFVDDDDDCKPKRKRVTGLSETERRQRRHALVIWLFGCLVWSGWP